MEFKSGEKYLCMLAPSFVSEWEYPQIIYRLRALGFDDVVELTFGAKMTNIGYYEVLKEYDDRTWIASPCPSIVSIVRGKYPHLLRNLVPVHSPMACMALIADKYYPDHKKVFVGPCLTKKLEAKEVGHIDEALTFKEVEAMLSEKNIPEVIDDPKYMVTFDKFYNDYTKIYPISGGLSSTLHHNKILKKSEIFVTDGCANVLKVLDEFKDGYYKNYRFLDILHCEGGCINGPGMAGNFPLKDRKQRVIKYRDYAQRYENDLGRAGKKVHAKGIDFRREF